MTISPPAGVRVGWTSVEFDEAAGPERIPDDLEAIALTTSGPRRAVVRDVVADPSVYEIRAWSGTGTEHRWVAGLGLSVVSAGVGTRDSAESCWLIERQYRLSKTETLATLEVFQAGQYGNANLVDEIILDAREQATGTQ